MVLAMNAAPCTERYHALPPRQVIEHLERHGVAAELLQFDGVPEAALARALQDEARDRAADVLVAGAFGHGTLREQLFGGVMLDLLGDLRLPLFLSH